MANVLGSLLVELGVNMAAFHEGMSKATYTAKQSAKDISNSFKTMGSALEGVLSHFGTMGTVVGSALNSVGSDMAELSAKMGSIKGVAGTALIGLGALGAGVLGALDPVWMLPVFLVEAPRQQLVPVEAASAMEFWP